MIEKPPTEGIVTYISPKGCAIRLKGDTYRYQGCRMRPVGTTYRYTQPIALTASYGDEHNVEVKLGDRVRVHWGGYGAQRVRHLEILELE